MGKKINLDGEEVQNSSPNDKSQYYQIGAILILLLVLGIAAFLMRREKSAERRERESQEELWHAQRYLDEGKRKKALHGDGFNLGFLAIYEKWSDRTKAGKLCRWYIAGIYMRQKKYEKVLGMLDGLVIDDELAQSQVLILQGDAHSELNQYEKALTYYEKAAQCAPNPLTTPRCYKKIAGILHMKGDIEGAKDYYQRICDEFPESPDHPDAEKHLGYFIGLTQKESKLDNGRRA